MSTKQYDPFYLRAGKCPEEGFIYLPSKQTPARAFWRECSRQTSQKQMKEINERLESFCWEV